MTHAEVLHAYGTFMVAWSVLDTAIEAAIMKQLKIDPQRALILTTSMQFRQRVSILCALLELSEKDHSATIKLLKKIEKDAKRNMLVHGHIVVGVPGHLTFVKSNIADGYSANRATFSAKNLAGHIMRLSEKTNQLQSLLGVTDEDMQLLANVGIKASA